MTHAESGIPTLKLAGELRGEETFELRRACDVLSSPFVVDLTELPFADAEGVAALLGLRARGAALVGARPYVSLLLEEGTP